MLYEIPSIMDLKEAGQLLHVGRTTMLKIIHEGQLDAVCRNNHWLITRKALEDYLAYGQPS
jgi:excisionase family DNA binding protein